METTIKFQMSEADRAAAEGKMSEAMGSYIQAMAESDPTKLDFSNWGSEEWQRFVGIAFDMASFETFKRRVVVLGPTQDAPF